MRVLNLLASAVVVLSCQLSLSADEHGDSKDAGFFVPSEIKWQEGPKSIPPGAKLAVLEGDPTKEGPFVMRLRLPDGYSIPPHTHPKTERLTVISGTFNIAMGEKLDKKSGRKMPAGTFGFWAAGMKHIVWAEGKPLQHYDAPGGTNLLSTRPRDFDLAASFDARYRSAAIWSGNLCCSTEPVSPDAFAGP